MKRNAFAPRNMKQCRGISLAEVLITLALAMIISASLASLFAQSVQTREQVDREGQRIEAGRYALDAMTDDIRLAGFLGGYIPRSTQNDAWPAVSRAAPTPAKAAVAWTAPNPCATVVADLGWNNDLTAGTITLPVAIFGYEAGHGTPATLPASLTACLPNYKAGTDVLVTRRLSTVPLAWCSSLSGWRDNCTTPTVAPNAADVYLQAGSCNNPTNPPPFVVSATSSSFTLQNMDCATSGALRKVVVRIYYVATCNQCGGADTIPTLKVAELGVPASATESAYHSDTNNWATGRNGTLSLTVRALTPGIENLHFEYGVDTDADRTAGAGSADSYRVSSATPTVSTPFLKPDGTTPWGWQNVMSVKVWALSRDLDQTAGYSSNKTFVLGSVSVGPFISSNPAVSASDIPFKRNVFASTIRLVNPAGMREIP